MTKKYKALMIGHYPLDQINSAPKIRTYWLWKSMAELVDLDFITGTREQRRLPLLKLILSGKWRAYDFVYIEAATSTSMEMDLTLMGLLKAADIPIGLFVRDAYPMFGWIRGDTLKNKLLIAGWYTSIWAYHRLSRILFFPTQKLADYFPFPDKRLLPPGTRPELIEEVHTQDKYTYVFYAGALNAETGSEVLLPAMEQVHQQNPDIKLLLLTRSKLEQKWQEKSWLEMKSGTLEDMKPYFPNIAFAILPRPESEYNHLAMPVKIFDYLSCGLPMVSTDCKETRALIERYELGVMSSDKPQELASSIVELLKQPQQIKRFKENVFQASQDVLTWQMRAKQLVNDMISVL